MSLKSFFTKEDTPTNRDGKEKTKGSWRQLQQFLDVADNIEREDLKKSVIAEMLKCDMILTELAEKQIKLISRRWKKWIITSKTEHTNF